MHSERARQWVHIGSGSFALLLRVLTWWQAAALAAAALAFNVVALPRIGGRRLYRPADEARGFPLGILVYPLSVLLLILIFPSRLDIVAAAWGVLALGDGAATLIGQAVTTIDAEPAEHAEKRGSATSAGSAFARRRGLPWNGEKTVAGTMGFIVFGGLGAVALALWVRPHVAPTPPLAFTIAAPLAAAIAAAFVESIPVRLDDNISVPASAAAVLWLASQMDAGAWHDSRAAVAAALWWAAGINLATAWAGYRARTVSVSGAISGAIVGLVIFAGGGARAWLLLFLTFLAAAITSRLGLKRKVLLGIAEERGGRRGAGNAIANCGVAVLAAIAAVTTPHPRAALIALVAALAATFEGPGILNNDMLNFINTAVAAAVALAIA